MYNYLPMESKKKKNLSEEFSANFFPFGIKEGKYHIDYV